MDGEIPAETRFITSAVQPEPDIDRLGALATQNLDWDQIVGEAVTRHKVGPVLYRNLIESGADELIPERTLERLRECSRRAATRNLSLTNLLLSLLDCFGEREIPALPYKGPALSEAVYGNLSLRQSRDLDILVRPDDLLDAEAILLERGFEPRRELAEKQKRLLVKHGRNRTMKKEGVIVDLHPRISIPDPPLEVTSLFERADSVDLSGEPVPAISAADNLFVLSVHGTRHRWNQLKWICDIAYLIHDESFAWPTVIEEAKRRKCYRRVLLGCGLASAVLGIRLPEAVDSGLRDAGPRLLDGTYPDCLFSTDDAPFRYRLRSRDDAVDKIRYCRNELTVPRVRETDNVPDWFLDVYYVVRPVRVVYSKLLNEIRALASKIRPSAR